MDLDGVGFASLADALAGADLGQLGQERLPLTFVETRHGGCFLGAALAVQGVQEAGGARTSA
ncbi:MAG TPA: hypothetical protein VFN71_10860 [Methylomirabilota bacterium]|nr:hypothetical protein [Methylomirabilota bacterium]